MKILHLADLHARDKDIDEIRKVFEFIVRTVQAEAPDLIAFAGDAFHSRDIKLDSLAAKEVIRFFSALADRAPVAGVLGTPSHDGRAPEILSLVRGRFPILLINKPEQVGLIDQEFHPRFLPLTAHAKPVAVISLCPQPTKEFWSSKGGIRQTDEEIMNAMTGVFMGFGAKAAAFDCPHILIGHFTVKGATTSTGQQMTGREIEISREQIEHAKADVVCLGHIHNSQWIEPNIYYSGSVYRENWGETEPKGFMLHDIHPHGRESHFIETPTKNLMKRDIDLTEGGIIEDLDTAFAGDAVAGSHVRIEIKTWQDEAAKIDREEIERHLMGSGAESVDIRIIRVPRETVRSTEIMAATDLPEKLKALANSRAEQVPAGILEKAHDLEVLPVENLMKAVTDGLGNNLA